MSLLRKSDIYSLSEAHLDLLIIVVAMRKNGRGERIRTSDPLVPNQVLYQAEPLPERVARYSRIESVPGRCFLFCRAKLNSVYQKIAIVGRMAQTSQDKCLLPNFRFFADNVDLRRDIFPTTRTQSLPHKPCVPAQECVLRAHGHHPSPGLARFFAG
jgi:hypothetical protein